MLCGSALCDLAAADMYTFFFFFFLYALVSTLGWAGPGRQLTGRTTSGLDSGEMVGECVVRLPLVNGPAQQMTERCLLWHSRYYLHGMAVVPCNSPLLQCVACGFVARPAQSTPFTPCLLA